MINFFEKIDLIDTFRENILEYIAETSIKIHLYQKYGIEDNRLSFEKSLRSKEGIVVSTVHGIKGDEFRVVISFGLLRGYLPHWNSIIETNTEKEDSNKLLFVLCSRAKEKLYLFAETGRINNKGTPYEINRELSAVLKDLSSNDN